MHGHLTMGPSAAPSTQMQTTRTQFWITTTLLGTAKGDNSLTVQGKKMERSAGPVKVNSNTTYLLNCWNVMIMSKVVYLISKIPYFTFLSKFWVKWIF